MKGFVFYASTDAFFFFSFASPFFRLFSLHIQRSHKLGHLHRMPFNHTASLTVQLVPLDLSLVSASQSLLRASHTRYLRQVSHLAQLMRAIFTTLLVSTCSHLLTLKCLYSFSHFVTLFFSTCSFLSCRVKKKKKFTPQVDEKFQWHSQSIYFNLTSCFAFVR